MQNPRKLVSSPSFLRRARLACAGFLGVATALIGGSASAQVSPLMGQWFAQTPTTQWRFIFTAGDAVTTFVSRNIDVASERLTSIYGADTSVDYFGDKEAFSMSFAAAKVGCLILGKARIAGWRRPTRTSS